MTTTNMKITTKTTIPRLSRSETKEGTEKRKEKQNLQKLISATLISADRRATVAKKVGRERGNGERRVIGGRKRLSWEVIEGILKDPRSPRCC